MMLSIDAFQWLVVVAMGITFFSPLILIGLLIRDWLKDELW